MEKIDETLDNAIKELEKQGKVEHITSEDLEKKSRKKSKPKINYAINYIKFIDFMKLYNFRDFHPTNGSNMDNDTKIIRIIYGDIFGNTFNADKYNWFEFGIYDFGPTRDFVESLNRIFSKEILNSYVYSYSVNDESGTFEIWLTNEPGDEWDD